MKLEAKYSIFLFVISGCAANTHATNNIYSCLDPDIQSVVTYKKEDVFYTWLKTGYGTIAFKASNGKLYQLHQEFLDQRVCSILGS